MRDPSALLDVRHLVKRFGGLTAINEVNLSVARGAVHAIIGPNGAGKTSVFNCVTSFNKPTSGEIFMAGERIDGLAAHVIAQHGIARTYQNVRLFAGLSALDNVLIGRHRRLQAPLWHAVVRSKRFREEEAEARAAGLALLEFVGISSRAEALARNLPYGDQRRLEIARALATEPRLVLLDEPAAGMNPSEARALVTLIGRIRDERGVSVLLIEHHMRVVMAISDRITVLERGQVLTQGTPRRGRPRRTRHCRLSRHALGGQLRPEPPQGAGCGMSMILDVQGLTVAYGQIAAVRDVSFAVEAGSIAAIIGANGAGKSTILNALSGLRTLTRGRIRLGPHDITGLPPHERVRLGLAQVPEGRRLFARMSVAENLEMGAFSRQDRSAIADGIAAVLAVFPRLAERRGQLAGTLSGGEQQMVAIGRAMMSAPQVLLLDEPTMGLAPQLVDAVLDAIVAINRSGVTVLLVEQNAYRALELADHAFVLESGEIALSGHGTRLLDDPRVRAAYLGLDA